MKQLNWYQIFGQTHTIPDGRTVTPTDDIQIWLNCANIWDKAYTTLAEVLADTDTLSALIASENAVDYMVRSTTWAVAQALIPKMTSDTTPSGVASITGTVINAAYKSFDRDKQTTSIASGVQRLIYEFDTAQMAVSAKWIPYQSDGSQTFNAHTLTFYGSNDGNTWTELGSKSVTVGDKTSLLSLTFSTPASYKYYSVLPSTTPLGSYSGMCELQLYTADGITDNSTAMSYIGLNNYCANTLLADSTWCEAICNSEYFESVLNVKVPAMTSNTTPEGVVSAYNYNYSNYPWHAFDGDSTTSSDMWASENLSTWIQYKFTTPKKIKCVRFRQFWNTSYQITAGIIKASDDGANFTDVKSFTNDPSLSYKYIYLNSNEDSYSYWRMHITAINSGAASLNELQFYGREDV